MVLPIVAYGDPVLKKVGEDVDENYPELTTLIENMFETMDYASGVGLAAPQIGRVIRLFIVDASPFAEEEDDKVEDVEENERLKTYRKVFINAEILDETGEEWAFEEGCLSIPNIREDVYRKPTITIEYWDENFKKHTDVVTGIAARIVQHEYDHIEGKLFTEHLKPLKRRLLKRKLQDISKGNTKVKYRMKFPLKKK